MSSVERRSVARLAQPVEYTSQEQKPQHPLAQTATPSITILLCTYNGARFLAAQLASIEQQIHRNWRLIISDDYSTDETLAIAHRFARRVSQPVEIRLGPGQGPCANFLSLAADPSIAGDYFAFCDQDDVWHRDRLSQALYWARVIAVDVPAVYGGRTHLVDASGLTLGYSPRFSKPPCFANALVQSIAGANTMLFNRAAKRLLEEAGPLNVVSHDWWIYQLVTGSGGIVHYDPEPRLDYRQHESNRIGSNRGLRAQWKRLCAVLNGGFSAWNEINLQALQQCRQLLTEDARALIDQFQALRRDQLSARLTGFVRLPVRRQTAIGSLALLMAVLLRRV